ncbi:MAG TPA: hypothetical protein VMW24_06730 [Sedimentisphaerales bacterium]|nr:hypothetical protein [Sedimentisphaerales bacterium]
MKCIAALLIGLSIFLAGCSVTPRTRLPVNESGPHVINIAISQEKVRPNKVYVSTVYVIDGEYVDHHVPDLLESKCKALSPSLGVRVTLPAKFDDIMFVDWLGLPWMTILDYWDRHGVACEWYQAGKRVHFHLLSWDGYMGLPDKPEDAVYILDGRSVGKGMQGIKALRSLGLGNDAIVVVAYPWTQGPSSPAAWLPPEGLDALLSDWYRDAVRQVSYLR